MGATASLILPPRISKDDFKEIGGNIYSEEFYKKLKGEDECIDRRELSDFAFSIADVYMYVTMKMMSLLTLLTSCL